MIIDAHTHNNPYRSLGLSADTPEEFVEILDHYGIDMALLSCGWTGSDVDRNDHAYAAAKAYPDRVKMVVILDPQREENLVKLLHLWVEDRGAVGLKIHCDTSNTMYDDPGFAPVVEEAGKLGVPVTLHTGKRCWESVEAATRNYPGTTFALGHFGNSMWPEAIELAKECPNACLETGGILFEEEAIGRMVGELGSKRVVYGSDLILVDPAMSIGFIQYAPITGDEKEDIFWRNANRLWKLGVSG